MDGCLSLLQFNMSHLRLIIKHPILFCAEIFRMSICISTGPSVILISQSCRFLYVMVSSRWFLRGEMCCSLSMRKNVRVALMWRSSNVSELGGSRERSDVLLNEIKLMRSLNLKHLSELNEAR